MTEKGNDKIFTAADIERYLNREMPADEMHALESAALEDPFLADAIDGYAAAVERKDTNLSLDIRDLHGRLQERVRKDERSALPLFLSRTKIAAILILLAGTGTLVYYLLEKQRQNETYLSQKKVNNQLSADTVAAAPLSQPDTSAVAGNDLADRSPRNSVLFNKAQEQPSAASSNHLKQSAPNPVTPQGEGERKSEEAFKKDIGYASANKPGRGVAAAPKAQALRGKTSVTDTNHFSGQVTGEGNQPVPGATISILDAEKRRDVIADSSGRFRFSSDDSVATVVVSSTRYDGSVAKLSSKNKQVNIRLSDSANVQQEVAANNTGSAPRQGARAAAPLSAHANAAPLTGWKAFNAYLQKNRKIPASHANDHGTVVLAFTVGQKGRPQNFRLIKSLNEVMDEEAIRLIREGPAWKIIKDDQSPSVVTVRF